MPMIFLFFDILSGSAYIPLACSLLFFCLLFPLRLTRIALSLLVACILYFCILHYFNLSNANYNPPAPAQKILNPFLTRTFQYTVVLLPLFTIPLLLIDCLRRHPPFALWRRITIAALFLLLPLASFAFYISESTSQNGEILASASSPDSSLHIVAIHGYNWEGDQAYLLYRRPPSFFYHPLATIGQDLITIHSVQIAFPAPNRMTITSLITHNIPDHPTETLSTTYDTSTNPPQKQTP